VFILGLVNYARKQSGKPYANSVVVGWHLVIIVLYLGGNAKFQSSIITRSSGSHLEKLRLRIEKGMKVERD
jgi:hypothetical protein